MAKAPDAAPVVKAPDAAVAKAPDAAVVAKAPDAAPKPKAPPKPKWKLRSVKALGVTSGAAKSALLKGVAGCPVGKSHKVKIMIGKTGKAKKVSVRPASSCVKSGISKARFPKPKGRFGTLTAKLTP